VLELAIICPRDLKVESMLTLIKHFRKNSSIRRTELNLSRSKLALQTSQNVQLLQQDVLELEILCPRNFASQSTRMSNKSVCQESQFVRAKLDLHTTLLPSTARAE